MADTILEALAEFSDKEYIGELNHDELIINDETREIFIPETEKLFGVESDDKTERKHFRCPRYVGDDIDLLKLSLRINYRNANDETDQYIVMDAAIEDGIEDEIVFSWLLSRKVTKYRGAVQFIVCAVKSENGKTTNEWNTTVATGEVIEGLEAEIDVTPEQTDILYQLVNITTESTNKANEAYENANAALSQADLLKTQLQELIAQAQQTIDKIEELQKNAFTENTPIEFETLSEPQNIVSGDSVRQIAQKAQSVFNELGEAAQYDVADSLSEISDTELQVPDARLLKQVNDKTYDDILNKPKINNVELVGNKNLEDIGVIKAITDILNDGAKIKYQVITDVSLLPETGESGIIYLVPPDEMLTEGEPVIENKFIEYMWVDDHYEPIGQVSAEQLVADAELNTTSENPVQNKVITAKVNEIETDIDSMNMVVNAQGEAITGLNNRTQSQGESIKSDVFNFKERVLISGNHDLNNYVVPGNYGCSSNVIVKTLLNCPTDKAFTLRVEYGAYGDYKLIQTICDYDLRMWKRIGTGEGTEKIWGEWKGGVDISKIQTAVQNGVRNVVTGDISLSDYMNASHIGSFGHHSGQISDIPDDFSYIGVFDNMFSIGDGDGKYIRQIYIPFDENVFLTRNFNADNTQSLSPWSMFYSTGKCFDIGIFPGEYSEENLKTQVHERMKVLANKVNKGVEPVQIAWFGEWPDVSWFTGQLTTEGDMYYTLFYSYSTVYLAFGKKDGSLMSFVRVGGGIVDTELLPCNTDYIDLNEVRICRYGNERVINGYIRIKSVPQDGATLITMKNSDMPITNMWIPCIEFEKGGTMNVNMNQNRADIYLNDEHPISTGFYNINVSYFVQ